MDNRDKQEEKNKRIGWVTSVGVQLMLLVLFYFLIAWREPFPPIPEYGIELGFTSSAGASAPVPQPNNLEEEVESEEVLPQEEIAEEVVEEVSTPQPEQLTEQEEVVTQEVQDLPVEEAEAVAETEPEEVVEELQEVPQEQEEPQVDERAVMPPAPSDDDGERNENTAGEEQNEEIDKRALYGSQGNTTGASEGASLSLSGWMWDFSPKPDDSSDQTGRIVYKIVVDQDGYLVKIETLTSTVSPAVERKYRAEVQKLTFSKTGDYQSAPLSTGTITFIIKAQ